MAKVLLCWEMGGGLGHAGRLKPLAQALTARGHDCAMVLRDLVQTDSLLADLPLPRLQAPVWLHKVSGLPDPMASLAEVLLANGYVQPAALAAQVKGWLAAFKLYRPQLVVADYAPTAVLAARIAGLPSAVVGLGFYMPPDAVPLPSFLEGNPMPAQQLNLRLAQSDALALASVNEVLRAFGRPPLPRLACLFAGDLPLLCTWPEMDHYGRAELPAGQHWYGPSFMAPGGEQPQWPTGEGPRAFAYLKAGFPHHLQVLRALVAKGCRTLCYMPELAAGKRPPLDSPLIHYAKGPVDLSQALPGCGLTVCHAGEATMAQSLLAGVPLLLLPMQREQSLITRQVARSGAAVNGATLSSPAALASALSKLLDQPEARTAAQAFAQRHGDFSHQRQVARLMEAFESLLP
ncbi:glycosyltransferase [Paucibacter sp. XJ19-41]|uniref:glycosyltransferase n=1 Tax=Paucibacter sp. XJ19-41 TaxID=2927824 RepID=UPI0023491271|nr:nucleotide disphospho-sugar-binding domain-containing protein [Paucibacter sp. XJ19-41]MDC6171219.1 glycosyltransferase [Paucibacter sp. XJ19-41]